MPDPEDKGTEFLMGFDLLKDMPREAMIDEILADQRRTMMGQDIKQLRAYVVGIRVENYKRRLLEEAGLEQSVLGFLTSKDEDADD